MSDSNNSGVVKPEVPTGPDRSDEYHIMMNWKEKGPMDPLDRLALTEIAKPKIKEVLEGPQTPPTPERK